MLFINAILAGIAIAIGGIVYLKVGGVLGALLFSTGLLSVVGFQFNLFTGKAGLLSTNQIKWYELMVIWCGNFIGACGMGLFFAMPEAQSIVQSRLDMPVWQCFGYAIPCGFLMYIAVTGYNQSKNIGFIIMPVATFILCGFQHCVADMFYYYSSRMLDGYGFIRLLATTIGNIVGCNLIPFARKHIEV